ncbi:AAA family ATPase [Methanolapillus millepedarum]|uniref:Cytidylate kinase n=1 Tax=Methanolapillus millepedarum TaxID=3028296 RepID=A0AA96V433_9EURY|nr:Cytidylate kinase [Methanosarcinaceae archaeon Ac7]
MIITISGLPGTGTTTISKKLLKSKTCTQMISAGEIFRNMAKERNMSLEDFGKTADFDLSIDQELEERMKQSAKCHSDDNFILLEGRLAAMAVEHFPHGDVLRVKLTAEDMTRYKRIQHREGGILEVLILTIN